MSDISLGYITQFGNISNVTITGQDHTVQCNHQGGLVGEGIINMSSICHKYKVSFGISAMEL